MVTWHNLKSEIQANNRFSTVHNILRVLLALLFATYFASTWSDCGDKCAVNTDCNTYDCSRCANGACAKGHPCGSGCAIGTDCDQTANCFDCIKNATSTNGTCGAGCKMKCSSESECHEPGCPNCVSGLCWKAGECGLKVCHNNGECPPECSKCSSNNGDLGYCLRGNTCGGTCLVDTDCDQVTDCRVCNAKVCTAGCGQFCRSASECLNPSCTFCSGNICVNSKAIRLN